MGSEAVKVLVVNCSAPSYNLGADKLARWLADEGCVVTTFAVTPGMREANDVGWFGLDGYDRVCLSAIFSWHVPIAAEIANRVKANAEVWAGGPAFHKLAGWFMERTGIEPNFTIRDGEKIYGGVDARFDSVRGDFRFAFATRGCDRRCPFCIVWQMEGVDFTMDWGFQPAPMLGDSNLSALPARWQDFIIQRYVETGTPLRDANSGFEPLTFTEETRARWEPHLRGAWRWAFDELIGNRGAEEAEGCERMARILKDQPGRRKRVYCVLGTEKMEACIERARRIIGWGAEPYCQVFIPLNHLGNVDNPRAKNFDPPRPRFDWPSHETLTDAKRFFNSPQIWRGRQIWEYKPDRSYRQSPFAHLKPLTVIA